VNISRGAGRGSIHSEEGTEKVWLKQYPKGITPEVDVTQYASLAAILARGCERFGTLPGHHNMGVSITYGELDRRNREFGAFLQKALIAMRFVDPTQLVSRVKEHPQR
jgi:hypothetical protein